MAALTVDPQVDEKRTKLYTYRKSENRPTDNPMFPRLTEAGAVTEEEDRKKEIVPLSFTIAKEVDVTVEGSISLISLPS